MATTRVCCTTMSGPSPVTYRKVLVLGHVGVGKTALTLQFVNGEFPEEYEPTLEDTYMKRFILGRAEYEVDLVDTTGHLEFSCLPPSFLDGIDGYIVMYSVDSLTSFQIAGRVCGMLQERSGRASLPILLVGNKKDIVVQRRQVSPYIGQRIADTLEIPFLEITATDHEECKQVFRKILKEIDRLQRSSTISTRCHLI